MRGTIAIAGVTLVAGLMSACSPARLLGAAEPAAPGGEARDIPYAAGPRHAMDLYLPASGLTPPPVVVFFYGGGWVSGDRAKYRFLGRSMAALGAMTVIPDYRVWPDAGFPEFLRDAAAAVGAARVEAIRRGGDPSRFFLMGHSAGAHIAAMLALDPEFLAGVGLDAKTSLAGMIGISGPYDFLPLNDLVLEQIFAPAGPRSQPITFAANAHAPLLLMTGADDRTVRPANTLRLAAKVREAGGQVNTIVYPGIGHTSIIAAFAAPLRFLAASRADTARFIGLAGAAGAETQGAATRSTASGSIQSTASGSIPSTASGSIQSTASGSIPSTASSR